MRRLQDLTAALLTATDTGQVLSIFVNAGRDALGADAGLCWMLRSGDTLELVAEAHNDAKPPTERFRKVPVSMNLPVCDVVRTAQMLMFETRDAMVARYPHFADSARAHAAWAIVALCTGGNAIGAASFSFTGPREFSEDDRDLLAAIANQTSLAYGRARLQEANQRSEAQLRHALAAARGDVDSRSAHRGARARSWKSRGPRARRDLGAAQSTGDTSR